MEVKTPGMSKEYLPGVRVALRDLFWAQCYGTLFFDYILRISLLEGGVIFGYADNGLLLIAAWSRQDLETRAADKMHAILLKGRLQRVPTVCFDRRLVRFVKTFKYLGFVIDIHLAFRAHICYLVDSGVTIFYRLKAVAPAN
ncbi:hypothetical protein PR048_001400 [Dryococelus australis]|uniref:Uncharacterized protein n=1 Tax=Dryococelus australis TaxID=614101 RepID=A0ABQ9IH79_9NEOP|nr:hypothetical protein PR048_001400 [Dryococelus australis]